MRTDKFEAVGVAVGTNYTVLLTQKLGGMYSVVNFEVTPAGGALTGFKVQVQQHPNGVFLDFLVDAHFDATNIPSMVWSSDIGPHEVGDGVTAGAKVRVSGVYAVRLLAKAGSAITATTRGTLGMED